jgi:hypothetical protein
VDGLVAELVARDDVDGEGLRVDRPPRALELRPADILHDVRAHPADGVREPVEEQRGVLGGEELIAQDQCMPSGGFGWAS